MKLSKKQSLINAAFCLALLGAVIWLMYAEYDRPWKVYQNEFSRLEYEVTAKRYRQLRGIQDEDTAAETARLKRKLRAIRSRNARIRQLWLRDLGKTDRCITCHQGADNSLLSEAPQPFTEHSGDYLKLHPVDTFGCVICHEGQGAALTVNAAHGNAENWSKPLLKGPYVQSSCGKCHPLDQGLPLESGFPGADSYTEGWRLFQQYNCIGCHTLPGYERPGYMAPSLSSVGGKVKKSWLFRWLKDPASYRAGTGMPAFGLSDEEIAYTADYLMSLMSSEGGPALPSPGGRASFSPEEIQKGKNLVRSMGCLGCHKIHEEGSGFGPDLSRVGSKVRPEWLMQYLRDPKSYDPRTPMPVLLTAESDIRSITAYLMNLAAPSEHVAAPSGPGQDRPLRDNIEKGEKLVKAYGCAGCHEIGMLQRNYNGPSLEGTGGKRTDELFFADMPEPDRTLINWLKLKIRKPHAFATENITPLMPDFHFTEKQTESLAVYLLSLKNSPVQEQYVTRPASPDTPRTKGRKIFETYNCLGCHRVNGSGGDIGPDLTQEAKKSRPEWLAGFLSRPSKIRPPQILRAGMPDFGLSDDEINSIVEYLTSLSGEPYPYYAPPPKKIHPADVTDGEKLYREIYACSGCHRIDGIGGEVGPDHTDVASRLKREWLRKWLENPQSVKPGVRMPRFTFRDWEFEALTNYLMTLGQYRFVRVKDD